MRAWVLNGMGTRGCKVASDIKKTSNKKKHFKGKLGELLSFGRVLTLVSLGGSRCRATLSAQERHSVSGVRLVGVRIGSWEG